MNVAYIFIMIVTGFGLTVSWMLRLECTSVSIVLAFIYCAAFAMLFVNTVFLKHKVQEDFTLFRIGSLGRKVKRLNRRCGKITTRLYLGPRDDRLLRRSIRLRQRRAILISRWYKVIWRHNNESLDSEVHMDRS